MAARASSREQTVAERFARRASSASASALAARRVQNTALLGVFNNPSPRALAIARVGRSRVTPAPRVSFRAADRRSRSPRPGAMDDDVATWIEEETRFGAARQIPSSAPTRRAQFGAASRRRARARRRLTPADASACSASTRTPRRRPRSRRTRSRGASPRPRAPRPRAPRDRAPADRRRDEPHARADADEDRRRRRRRRLRGRARGRHGRRRLSRQRAARGPRLLADVVRAVETGETTVADAPAAFESACRAEACASHETRGERTQRRQGERPQAEADAPVAEAATWSLVWYLLGEGADSERRNAEAERRFATRPRHFAERESATRRADRHPGREDEAPPRRPLSARVRMAARCSPTPTTFPPSAAWHGGGMSLARASPAVNSSDSHAGGRPRRASRREEPRPRSTISPPECAAETAQAAGGEGGFGRRRGRPPSSLTSDEPTALADGRGRHPTGADADAGCESRVGSSCAAATSWPRGFVCRRVELGGPGACARTAGRSFRARAGMGAAADRRRRGRGSIKRWRRRATRSRGRGGGASGEQRAPRRGEPRGGRRTAALLRGFDGDAMDFSGDGPGTWIPRCPRAQCARRWRRRRAATRPRRGGRAPAVDVRARRPGANRRALEEVGVRGDGEADRRRLPRGPRRRRFGLDVSSGGSTTNASSAARLESAAYGALAGDARATRARVRRRLGRSAWALFRALLDHRVDAAVAGRTPGEPGDVLADADEADADTVEYSADDAWNDLRSTGREGRDPR